MIVLTEKEQLARNRLCLPLDVKSYDEAVSLVNELHEVVGIYKVGKELFTSEGPRVIDVIRSASVEAFLDLKYHDIPNTVKGAAKAATRLGVYMFNVHASGGTEMMKAAVQGVNESIEELVSKRRPKVVAVTVLTSIDDRIMNEELRIPGKVEDQVLHYAKLADSAGLDGIVCSAADLYAVRDKMRKDFIYVTPGIKAIGSVAGADQKRVFTPGNAIQDGASILVAGRTITQAKGKETTYDDMRTAAHGILKDMAQYL